MDEQKLNEVLDLLSEAYNKLGETGNGDVVDEIKEKIEQASSLINEQILELL